LHRLLVPLPGRMAEVIDGGVPLADLLKGMAGEVAGAVEGQANAANAADSLGLGRQPVGHRPQVGHDHRRDRHLVFCEQGAIRQHQPEARQHLREVLIQAGGGCAAEGLGQLLCQEAGRGLHDPGVQRHVVAAQNPIGSFSSSITSSPPSIREA